MTNKETRKSNGYALFDTESLEPILFDDNTESWFSEFSLHNDFLAYRPSKDGTGPVHILDLLEGSNSTSPDYVQLKKIHSINNIQYLKK